MVRTSVIGKKIEIILDRNLIWIKVKEKLCWQGIHKILPTLNSFYKIGPLAKKCMSNWDAVKKKHLEKWRTKIVFSLHDSALAH